MSTVEFRQQVQKQWAFVYPIIKMNACKQFNAVNVSLYEFEKSIAVNGADRFAGTASSMKATQAFAKLFTKGWLAQKKEQYNIQFRYLLPVEKTLVNQQAAKEVKLLEEFWSDYFKMKVA
ncbi:MAG: hypothetical protein V7782_07600 [Psychromonas sp.]